MNLNLLILKNKIKLEQMINNNVEYKKILAQSKRLDNYIVQYYKEQEKSKTVYNRVNINLQNFTKSN